MPRQIPAQDKTQLHINLLGRPHIERQTQPIQLPTRKTEALLAYLILHPQSHGREKLAALLWGDSSDTEARNSLRNALAVLNKKLGHDLLLVDRQSISINPEYPLWVDALVFESQAAEFLAAPSSDLKQVKIELYQEDLLSDFYDDWIFPLREHYRSLFLDTLLQLTEQMRSQSEYGKTIEYARKVITFDPANERAHQHIMFCHAATGDRNAALKQYEECQRILAEELGVEPAAETTALYDWAKQSSPAKPLEARITNLPISLTAFIGRKRELTEIKQRLSSTRLLTLTGPGGSGKTRLALQIGTELLDTFKDGVWWVDLTALTDTSLVSYSIAKSLGVHEIANQPLEETLAHFLHAKNLLLILDNCEHLIEPCAHIVHFLSGRCSQLTILATSREFLNVAGEQTWQVPTLSLPDPQKISLIDLLLEYEGIRLFDERARTANTSFTLTEQNASFIAQICSRLDGIPLAIELAAARIKLLTPEQIADRLDDRFCLLTNGSRTVPPRHQTLQAVMDWSYGLLNDKEQRLFRSLAVFAGSWGLDATEAICSANGHLEKSEILGLLSNLVDKSLVVREGDQNGKSRYRMLETIRQYALETLSRSGESHEVQKHHLDYYLNVVESAKPHLGFFMTDREMLAWLGVFVPDHDNLRAAIRFCEANPSHVEAGLKMAGDLHWDFLISNRLSEGRDWINKLQVKKSTVSAPVQAQACLTSGFLACWQGDFTSARPNLEASLKFFEEINNKSGIAFSLHGLGFAANGLGDHAEAGQCFGRCLQIAKEIDDRWLTSIALHFIAIGTSFQGNYELARSQFEECIKLMQDGHGTTQGVAFSEFHLGRIARIYGDFESSFAHHKTGLELFMNMGDLRGIGYSLFGFACLAQAEEDPQRAGKLFGAMDLIRENLGTFLEAALQIEYEHTRSAVQEMLGEEQFTAMWTEGHGLPLERAVHFALGPR
jgi:predicted ATPase/DNA-binding SARP family transcriptional activator